MMADVKFSDLTESSTGFAEHTVLAVTQDVSGTLTSLKVTLGADSPVLGVQFTTGEKTKLAGIEAGAQVNVGQEFTQTEKDKLAGVESGAQANVGVEFTQVEKTKLGGIETGAQVNVGQEFTQTEKDKLAGIEAGATAGVGLSEGEVDARVRVVASEAVVTISQLDPQNRVTFSRLDGQNDFVLDLSSLAAGGGGGTPTPPTPMLSDFRLTSTPESSGRIDATASLVGQRFITFNARNHENIHTLELEINGIRVGSWSGTALTEGTQSRAYTVLQNAWDQIIAANATELTFTLEAQDADGNVQDTQTVVVTRAAEHPVTDEHGYVFASASDSPTSIPSGATRWDATGNSWSSGDTETSINNGQYLIILAPEDSDLTSITETTFNIDSTAQFTRTVVSIGSVQYAQYVRQYNGGGTSIYAFRIERSA